MGFLDHIRAANTDDLSGYRPFLIGDTRVGWIRHALAEALPGVDPGFVTTADRIELAPELRDFEARSAALAHAAAYLVEAGTVASLRGEPYPVMGRWGDEPLARIDRAAVAPFGVASYGIHVNGFVRQPDGGLSLWVGLRARDRAVSPGRLDNLVAGGQPLGLTLAENLVKEAHEEAGIAADLIGRARPVGAVSYLMETDLGLKPDTLFLYDLELDPSFVPVNTDGEVESFELWPVERVAESVRDTDRWKFNVNLTVIDFLIRHGHLTPDHPEYLDLVTGLRRPL
ncbi:DUF4743 domain-containing protein [Azospirillum sp. A39]|uniref:DUF4743 domain-containing protein n=1 Tax=Azospirillum sp. A39 TaxID=3462279 RepID=UPI004045F598